MEKKIPVILLNFTGVYNLEAFASNKNIIHVDCQDMKGGIAIVMKKAGKNCIVGLLLFLPRQFIS